MQEEGEKNTARLLCLTNEYEMGVLHRFFIPLVKSLPASVKSHCTVRHGSSFLPFSDHLLRMRVVGFQRSIHDAKFQKPLELTGSDNEKTVGLAENVDKLCKILINHRDSSAVEAALDSTGVEASPPLVLAALKKLGNAGVLALSFFRWAETRRGFKHTTETYNALILALGKIKQFKMVWSLVDDMKRKNLLGRETFALICRVYTRVRKAREAIETFEKMGKFGMNPETSDYNRLIDNLSKSGNLKKAQEVFDKMKKRKFAPNAKTYTILLEGWCQGTNPQRVKDLFEEMRDAGLEPDAVSYGIVIHAHCKAKELDEAVRIFHDMEAKNCKPTPPIYCILINGLGSVRRLNQALEFFELYKANGFPPELPTYNALMGAYCWSMQIQDAYRMVEDMRKCGIGPTSRTYDIIIHHLIKARRTQEAYSVFQQMGSGCEPTVVTYDTIVRMFCNEHQIDMALEVWDQMKAKGVLPGMHMFFNLVNGLCHENRLEDACKYFHEMLDMGIRPPGQMFSSLKQALLDGGREDAFLGLRQRLEKLRKTPSIG